VLWFLLFYLAHYMEEPNSHTLSLIIFNDRTKVS
jgi:hypothetical protein